MGRHFLRYAADSNLKRVTLECGGKSPQIVMADAADDLGDVAEQLAKAAFWNTGQNCTAGSRILVERSVRGQVIEALSAVAAGLRVGDPLDRATRLGAIIEPEALQRILRYIDEACRPAPASPSAAGASSRRRAAGSCSPPS